MEALIPERLEKIKEEIRAVCEDCGRDAASVRLLPVSKRKPASLIQAAYDAGERGFGENHVQEICEKCEVLPRDIAWHMIGHLQRNKVRQVIDKAVLIHSLDSLRLASEINREAEKRNIIVHVLLEVNVGREESKSGFLPEELLQAAREISALPNLRTDGLMTVAPSAEDPEQVRPVFRQLRELGEQITAEGLPRMEMKELSMGMSDDFAVAIQEGATIIRVGTAIFGPRNYQNK